VTATALAVLVGCTVGGESGVASRRAQEGGRRGPETGAAAGGSTAGLAERLGHIEAHVAGARVLLAGDAAALERSIDRVLRSFWADVHRRYAPLPEAGDLAAGAVPLAEARSEAARAVLVAAYAGPVALGKEPLLRITADALGGLVQRIDEQAAYHDLVCLFHGCAGRLTPLTGLVDILAALPDREALGRAVAAAPLTSRWREAFEAVVRGHDRLVAAYRDAAADPAAPLAALLDRPASPGAIQLGAIVAGARRRQALFARTGLLSPGDRSLPLTLEEARRARLVELFQRRTDALRLLARDNQQLRVGGVRLLVERIQAGNRGSELAARVRLLRSRLVTLSDALAAARNNQAAATAQHAAFLQAFHALARRPSWPADHALREVPVQLTVSAASARAVAPLRDHRELVDAAVRAPGAVEPWSLRAQRGDRLELTVAGSWSPTCALADLRMQAPGLDVGLDLSTRPLTGPEGYTVQWSDNRLRAVAQSHSRLQYSQRGHASSVCGNLSLGLGGAIPPLSGALGVLGSRCRSWERGERVSDEVLTSDTWSRQLNLLFQGGVKVPTTPLPALPAGSLLLVEVEAHEGWQRRVRDVHVVERQTVLQFHGDAELYLLVNDRTGCAAAPGDGLALRGALVTPLGPAGSTAGHRLASAMSAAFESLAAAAGERIAEGVLSASELALLREQVGNQISAACGGCALPEPVAGMVREWLQFHLSSLERAVAIAQLERQRDELALEIEATTGSLAHTGEEARLLDLLASWELERMSSRELQTGVEELLAFARSSVHPVMLLHHPEALDTIRTVGSITGYAEDVLAAEAGVTPIETVAALTATYAGKIAEQLGNAALLQRVDTRRLVLRFPRPPVPGEAGEAGWLRSTPGRWIDAHPGRSSAVWQPVTDPASGAPGGYTLAPVLQLEISPEDIYGRARGGIDCGHAAPVIRSMALYLATDADEATVEWWNETLNAAPAVASPDLAFPHELGILHYQLRPELRPLRLLAGREADVLGVYQRHMPVSPELGHVGISPFTTFTIDLSQLLSEQLLAQTHTVIAVLEVDTRAAGSPLAGLSACARP
jgi:hypothetical protein